MTEPTPGPWIVVETGRWEETNHFFGIESTDASSVRQVAKIEGMGSEFEANAHLIAAAPDLLEALEELRQDVISFLDGDGASLKDAIDAAQETIAKAKGQTP